MNVAFDSRPVRDTHGVGRYTRCLLDALRETAQADARDRRDAPPWARGRVPLAVDERRAAAQPMPDGRHAARPDGAEASQRAAADGRAPAAAPARRAARGARDRADGGARPGRADAAWRRARADRRDPRGAGSLHVPAPAARDRGGAQALRAARALPAVGRRPAAPGPGQTRRPSWRRHRARCRSCWSARPAHGRTSCPT